MCYFWPPLFPASEPTGLPRKGFSPLRELFPAADAFAGARRAAEQAVKGEEADEPLAPRRTISRKDPAHKLAYYANTKTRRLFLAATVFGQALLLFPWTLRRSFGP